MGNAGSGGIAYGGFQLPFTADEGLSYSGPYTMNTEDMIVNKGISLQNNYMAGDKLPYFRCALFKRSLDFCAEAEYTYDSDKNRCVDEREDHLNCLYRGKEHRFQTIWGTVHSKEAGERTFVKFQNNWEKSRYDEDHGDYLERAMNIKNMYESKGLQGPKWQGGVE
eukprot:TRINITY_DN5750_c1_g1_i1.p1 TRINITY_DN5750_c1_g1~~TRINITY_DN5750_c1_g1_i1.p1  ORF type:complete len:180 (+),score=10.95 TRINITY_DN5750_c1_g1_i1:45-542(+)